jgi:hypothetical protein
MKNLEKLNILSDENQIDLESLNNFLLEKDDEYLRFLFLIENLQNIDINENNYNKYIQYYNNRYLRFKNFQETKEILLLDGMNLAEVPLPLRNYELCTIAVTQFWGALQYVPKNIKDYEICEIAVSKNGWALQYVPYDLEDYYYLVFMLYSKDKNSINKSYFPKEYLRRLKKDFPEIQLKEYISKEVRKLLKETLFNLK